MKFKVSGVAAVLYAHAEPAFGDVVLKDFAVQDDGGWVGG